MNSYCLSASNENQLRGALNSVGLRKELPEGSNGNPHYGAVYKNGARYDLDWIGKVVDKPGTYDEDGNEVSPPTFHPGVYCNIYTKAELPTSLQGYLVEPNPNYRVLAGSV